AATRGPIEHKVPTPDVVLVFRSSQLTTVDAHPQTPAFSLLARHFQPFPAAQSIDPRVAGPPGCLSQQGPDPAITESWTLTNQGTHPFRQSLFIIPRLHLITLTAARLIQHLARPSLGHLKPVWQFARRR